MILGDTLTLIKECKLYTFGHAYAWMPSVPTVLPGERGRIRVDLSHMSKFKVISKI